MNRKTTTIATDLANYITVMYIDFKRTRHNLRVDLPKVVYVVRDRHFNRREIRREKGKNSKNLISAIFIIDLF